MEATIQTYVEASVVLLIVSLAAYSLVKRFLIPKAQQKVCGGGCGGSSCSGCGRHQNAAKPSQLAALVASSKNQRRIDQSTIAIVPIPERFRN